jgi:alpha-D-xyloside xylohydrolase
MVEQLEALGIKLMVSVWPTIDRNCSQFAQMHAQGLLVRAERGVATTMEFLGDTVFFDPTNPKAREHVWKIIKQNYYDKGVRIFWLDERSPSTQCMILTTTATTWVRTCRSATSIR